MENRLNDKKNERANFQLLDNIEGKNGKLATRVINTLILYRIYKYPLERGKPLKNKDFLELYNFSENNLKVEGNFKIVQYGEKSHKLIEDYLKASNLIS